MKLEEVLVTKKDYSKEEKAILKKKQYGIYFDEAEKNLNKLSLIKKNKSKSQNK